MKPRIFTVYDILERNVRCFPNGIALCEAAENISHVQYKDAADRLAFGLIKRGLEKGDRIGILAKNSLESFMLLAAGAKAGAVMVPINWRLSCQELEYILNDCRPKFLFVDNEYQDLVSTFKAPSVKEWFLIDADAGKALSARALMEAGHDTASAKAAPQDAFVIIYTAAVSGRPRGAVLTHQNIISANIEYAASLRLDNRDSHLTATPLCHIACLGLSIAVLHAGGRNVIIPKFEKGLAVTTIECQNVTIMASFPPILEALLDEAKSSSRKLSSLRYVVGYDRREITQRLKNETGAIFALGYGQTETSGVISLGISLEKPGSVGRGGVLMDIRIVDDEGREVKAGEVGEAVIRGPSVFKGYWNCPDATEYASRGGWHHTGDLCRRCDDGLLYFVGRKSEKELIKPGGENVYPAEVEDIILQHPSVKEVCVIGVQDDKWGEAVKAICVLHSGLILPEDELKEFVGARISRIKKPKYVTFVPDLYKRGDGLIDREKVKAEYGKQLEDRTY